MLLGYTYTDWCKIARVYEHDNEKRPKDIWELKTWYHSTFTNCPSSHERFFIKLAASKDIKTDYVFDMLENIRIGLNA